MVVSKLQVKGWPDQSLIFSPPHLMGVLPDPTPADKYSDWCSDEGPAYHSVIGLSLHRQNLEVNNQPPIFRVMLLDTLHRHSNLYAQQSDSKL